MSILNNVDLYLAMVDIDGTIKDLVEETTNALIRTMESMGNINLKLRGKFVLCVNKINMYFVKTGLLPTNSFMQKTLLLFYSILLLKKYEKFKNKYFEEYNKENVFFECAEEMIDNLHNSQLNVYLVTKNRQNKRILQLKNTSIVKDISKIIIGRRNVTKYSVFKSFLSNRYIHKDDVLIVGDNFWDDVLPALLLGTTVVWCNMYKSKLKWCIIKILKLFFRNIKEDSELFITN